MTNVFETSQKLVVENVKEKSFNSPQNTDDLTEIKGIGPATAIKLNNAKIISFKQLADVSPEILSEIPGINLTTAYKFITGAKSILDGYQDQNSFNEENSVKEKMVEIVEHKKEAEMDEIGILEVMGLIVEEDLSQEKFQRNEEEIELTQEQWFEDKHNYSRLSASYPPMSKKFSNESVIEIEETQEHLEQPQEQSENMFNEESFMVEKPEEEDSREETSFVPKTNEIFEIDKIPKITKRRDTREETRHFIEELLKNSGYYIIPNTIDTLNPFIEKIDYLGCKLVRVSKWVNHIFLIPIKICDLEGTVLVDEAKLDYDTMAIEGRNESMSRLRHYYNNLLSTRDLAFDDIINGKYFRDFFQKYLQVNLMLEKSVENKKLFFISGQTQYKVLIEPIMLSKSPPRCMEKSLSFPYQRSTNIHVIHQPDLSLLLGFIEQKYKLIESRVTSSNTIKNYQKIDEKFRKNVRIASIPLVGYGIALSVIYFAEFFFLLRLFNSIGFAFVGIYLSILAYLYLKFYRAKKELSIKFETPYYMQNLEFSETDLLEFKDQLTTEDMAQFGYECFGKDKNFKVLEQIEKDNILNFVNAKKIEHDSSILPKSEEEKEEVVIVQKSEFSNKYLSFLED
ncbi:MAG: helix-hairpin-helix domain-containing protein [Candidatus Lokiarchaeota archaeon]|nr:helix-hairpin-helix domain-containing protein [Candidatus Lokiarchaeota archaeon]